VKWSAYNQSPVIRGETLLGLDVIDNWDAKLKEMNKDESGEPIYFFFYLDTSKCDFSCHVGKPKELHKDMLNGRYPIFPITLQ
jgi:hypothetical protein